MAVLWGQKTFADIEKHFTDLNLLVCGALSNGPSRTTTSLGWVTNFGGILLEALFGVPMTMEISHCPSIVPDFLVGFPFQVVR